METQPAYAATPMPVNTASDRLLGELSALLTTLEQQIVETEKRLQALHAERAALVNGLRGITGDAPCPPCR